MRAVESDTQTRRRSGQSINRQTSLVCTKTLQWLCPGGSSCLPSSRPPRLYCDCFWCCCLRAYLDEPVRVGSPRPKKKAGNKMQQNRCPVPLRPSLLTWTNGARPQEDRPDQKKQQMGNPSLAQCPGLFFFLSLTLLQSCLIHVLARREKNKKREKCAERSLPFFASSPFPFAPAPVKCKQSN